MNSRKKKLSKHAPVNFEDFKAVMLSEDANERFKFLIKAIRNQIRKGKFDNVNSDVKYLPTDLSMMMSHLFQMSLHSHLKTQLIQKILEERKSSITEILREKAKVEDALSPKNSPRKSKS